MATNPGSACILLVCDVGEGIGLGHWSRSRALSNALRQMGARTRLLAFGDELPAIRDHFPEYRCVGRDADFERELVQDAKVHAPSAIVFDLHPRRLALPLADIFQRLSGMGCRLVGVDSVRGLADALDLICIPSFHVDADYRLRYARKLVSGWESVLVEARLPVSNWSPAGKVLVLTGGTDATGLGESLPHLLERTLRSGTRVDWIRGPYAPPPRLPSERVLDWKVFEAPDGLDAHMATSSFALTVFGVSLLELMKYGVPTVVFSPYGSANDTELQVLRSTDACCVARDAEEAAPALAELMANAGLARRYREASLRLLASAGPQHLAKRLIQMIG